MPLYPPAGGGGSTPVGLVQYLQGASPSGGSNGDVAAVLSSATANYLPAAITQKAGGAWPSSVEQYGAEVAWPVYVQGLTLGRSLGWSVVIASTVPSGWMLSGSCVYSGGWGTSVVDSSPGDQQLGMNGVLNTAANLSFVAMLAKVTTVPTEAGGYIAFGAGTGGVGTQLAVGTGGTIGITQLSSGLGNTSASGIVHAGDFVFYQRFGQYYRAICLNGSTGVPRTGGDVSFVNFTGYDGQIGPTALTINFVGTSVGRLASGIYAAG